MTGFLVPFGGAQDRLEPAAGAGADAFPDGIEPLVRGPVHEAYAQPIDFSPGPGPAVPKPPPAPIPEAPPEMQPEGDNIQWIPGYWAWDPEAGQFRWVSGVYRDAPPGREWVPGRWTYTDDGWVWVPGFWADARSQELPYVPQPPDSLDMGPSVPPPDDNSFYVPGVWLYRDTRFVWRPGFWAACRPDSIWIPARYLWTPGGYVYCSGYRDYPIERRGLAFAPVRFQRALWNDPRWAYRPGYVVRPSVFTDALFVNRGHYYFGNYYARAGFQPWWDASRLDPHTAYYRWQHRDNPNWSRDLKALYVERGAGRALAPPTTFEQQRTLLARADTTAATRRVVNMVTPVTSPDLGLRVTRGSAAQIERQKASAQHGREIARARERIEVTPPARGAGTTTARSLKLPVAGAVPSPRIDSGKIGRIDTGVPRVIGTPHVDAAKPRFEAYRPLTPPSGVGGGAKSSPRVVTSDMPKVITTPKTVTTPRYEAPRRIESPRFETPRVTPSTVMPRIAPSTVAPRTIAPPRTSASSPSPTVRHSAPPPSATHRAAHISPAPSHAAPSHAIPARTGSAHGGKGHGKGG